MIQKKNWYKVLTQKKKHWVLLDSDQRLILNRGYRSANWAKDRVTGSRKCFVCLLSIFFGNCFIGLLSASVLIVRAFYKFLIILNNTAVTIKIPVCQLQIAPTFLQKMTWISEKRFSTDTNMVHDGQKELQTIYDLQLFLCPRCPGVRCNVNRHIWGSRGRCGAAGEGGSKINIVAAIIASEAVDAPAPRKPATLFPIHVLAEYPTCVVAENETREILSWVGKHRRQSKQNTNCV